MMIDHDLTNSVLLQSRKLCARIEESLVRCQVTHLQTGNRKLYERKQEISIKAPAIIIIPPVITHELIVFITNMISEAEEGLDIKATPFLFGKHIIAKITPK